MRVLSKKLLDLTATANNSLNRSALKAQAHANRSEVKDMFDETILDGKSFDELNDALEYIVEKIEEVEDETPEGEKDPRFDALCVIANKIVVRMNSIVRETGDTDPELLARWNETIKSYEEGFEKYVEPFLDDDTPIN